MVAALLFRSLKRDEPFTNFASWPVAFLWHFFWIHLLTAVKHLYRLSLLFFFPYGYTVVTLRDNFTKNAA